MSRLKRILANRWIRRLAVAAPLVAVAAFGYSKAHRYAMEQGYVLVNEYDTRTEGVLKVGDPAPDLSLAVVDGEPMRLSELWAAKPLVLVFGSYT